MFANKSLFPHLPLKQMPKNVDKQLKHGIFIFINPINLSKIFRNYYQT